MSVGIVISSQGLAKMNFARHPGQCRGIIAGSFSLVFLPQPVF
jgi:hypothetical protein